MTDTAYSIVKDGLVINAIVWDGEGDMDFGEGTTAVLMVDGEGGNIGDIYKDGKFTPPPMTDQQLEEKKLIDKEININTKASLMNEAVNQIGLLQDAVDLEMATDEESRLLPLWRKYRILLNRIDANTADQIQWPDIPV